MKKLFFLGLMLGFAFSTNFFSQNPPAENSENKKNQKWLANNLARESDQIDKVVFKGCQVEMTEKIRQLNKSVTRYSGFNRDGMPDDGFGHRGGDFADESHYYYIKKKITFNLAHLDPNRLSINHSFSVPQLFVTVVDGERMISVKFKKNITAHGLYSFRIKNRLAEQIKESFIKAIQQCK